MGTWLLRSAIVALYPRTDVFPGVEDCGLDEFLSKFREETTFLMWLGAIAGAFVFHLTPVLTVGWPLPAFALPPKTLDRHAGKISSSDVYLLRQAMFVVKLIAGLCWGADPRVRARFNLKPMPADPGTWRR